MIWIYSTNLISPQQSPRTIDPKRSQQPSLTLSHVRSRNVTFATLPRKFHTIHYHPRILTTSNKWDSMKILGISMEMNVENQHTEFLQR